MGLGRSPITDTNTLDVIPIYQLCKKKNVILADKTVLNFSDTSHQTISKVTEKIELSEVLGNNHKSRRLFSETGESL